LERSKLVLLFLVAVIGGCSNISEEQKYFINRDWQRIKTWDVMPITDEDTSSFDTESPLASSRERVAERAICLHPNGENRLIMEDGVSDHVNYRRCTLAPYPVGDATPGQRMNGRPDDLAPQPNTPKVRSIRVING
jgi:hypothetical protein